MTRPETSLDLSAGHLPLPMAHTVSPTLLLNHPLERPAVPSPKAALHLPPAEAPFLPLLPATPAAASGPCMPGLAPSGSPDPAHLAADLASSSAAQVAPSGHLRKLRMREQDLLHLSASPSTPTAADAIYRASSHSPLSLTPHTLPQSPLPASFLLISGNLMKNGCSRKCPSMTTAQELFYALDAAVRRNERTIADAVGINHDDPCSSSDENELREDHLLASLTTATAGTSASPILELLSAEDEQLLAKYQCCTTSPPPSPSRLSLPPPTRAIIDNAYLEKIIDTERTELLCSAKIFLRKSAPFSAFYLRQAVDALCLYLKTSYLDSLVLSFFDSANEAQNEDVYEMNLHHNAISASSSAAPTTSSLSCLEDVRRYWPVLENLVEHGRVLSIGTSNLNESELDSLLSAVKIKPKVNQIQLPSCHTLPRDLIAYGKAHDIEITTHKDAPDLLRSTSVRDLFDKHSVDRPSVVEPIWIVRYTFYIKSRGIMSSKGYMVFVANEPVQ